MKKTILTIVMATLCLFFKAHARQSHLAVKGKIVDEKGLAIPGATVKIKQTAQTTTSDHQGRFSFLTARSADTLILTFVGYVTREIPVNNRSDLGEIRLAPNVNQLNLVEISTGYQTIPKERATGSFVTVDSTLISRRVSTNILERLDGVTSGLIFNKPSTGINLPAISVRGRSTLFANAEPLIVLDNFPYEGNINNINPNDVASITLLKDAAAASIWGVKAANGVIVITTKKGRKSDRPNLSFNSSTMLSQRPDLHYQQWMSPEDYISMEQFLFKNGYYEDNINNGYTAISPAIAIMLQRRDQQISSQDSASAINQLKSFDPRKEMERYQYRAAVSQQYALSLDGGTAYSKYYLSAGYNSDQQALRTNTAERLTLNAGNNFSFLKGKLHLSAGLLLTLSNQKNNTDAYSIPFTPYDRLTDEQGNHLAVVTESGLRKQYTDTAGNGKLLDWAYRPLDENTANSQSSLTDYLIKSSLRYTVLQGLDLSLSYQYQKGEQTGKTLHQQDAFYTRNLVNSFSFFDPSGNLIRPVPQGAIHILQNSAYLSHYLRGQVNYSKVFSEDHRVDLLGGAEFKDARTDASGSTSYGFNTSTFSAIPVDYLTPFAQYYNGWYATIPENARQSYTIDRFRSLFFNGSYTYLNTYTLSASARRDESNLFGVKANQKGVPLWSAGIMWNLSQEAFYHSLLIPQLKFRATYGYNGNLDRTVSAYLTARNISVNPWNAPYSDVINPPNPSLRWERVENINLGIDFASKKNLLSGSLEYFIKKGKDLIGNSPVAPQSGVIQFRGNSADTRTTGIDLVINKNPLSLQSLQWESNFLMSYNKETVTGYKVRQGSNLSIVNANYTNPLEGFPYYSVFGFKSAGLDQSGQAQGILNGESSKDYSAINNSTDASQLEYIGSAAPLWYGSFRNTFSYRNFSLSLNIIYKLNYYFRRSNVFSGSSYTYLSSSFNERWQQPGDEMKTFIPALTYPLNSAADAFFRSTSQLVEKADHIRLQDIRLGYRVGSATPNILLRNLQIYAYANNLGILWKASSTAVDPDFSASPYIYPKSISLGLTTNF